MRDSGIFARGKSKKSLQNLREKYSTASGEINETLQLRDGRLQDLLFLEVYTNFVKKKFR